MLSVETFGYAFLGGILPALLWLYFLLKEDARCPEPRSMILVAFIAGMIAVPLVLPFESLAVAWLPAGASVVLSWAAIEEIAKYALAALLILWRRSVNESIDLVIYMITVALGFAALENAFFLITPFAQGHFITGIATDNLRFVGSTLLHVVASASVGFSLAFAYKRSRLIQVLAGAGGLILAIALHALFNLLIIRADGTHTLLAFLFVWGGAVVLLALFEVLKYFRYRNVPKNTCDVV